MTKTEGLMPCPTEREFSRYEFTDRYGHQCSIQKSSLATEECIWLGLDDAKPLIMAKDAARLGLRSSITAGWIEFPVPSDVLLHTRMHLTQDQAAMLIPMLQCFVDTGELCNTRHTPSPQDIEAAALDYHRDMNNSTAPQAVFKAGVQWALNWKGEMRWNM